MYLYVGTLQALEIEWAIEALRSVHHCDATVLPRVLKIAPAKSVDGAVIREALVRIGPRLRELRGDGNESDVFEMKLQCLVGLDEIKAHMRALRKMMQNNQYRSSFGLATDAVRPLHMLFKGNPGTGKTSVAKIVASLLHQIGAVATNNFVEAQRCDLVGQYVGQTAPRTRAVVDKAKGGTPSKPLL